MNRIFKWLCLIVILTTAFTFVSVLFGYKPSVRSIATDQITIIIMFIYLFLNYRNAQRKEIKGEELLSSAIVRRIGEHRCVFINLKDKTSFVIFVDKNNKLSGKVFDDEFKEWLSE